MRTAAGYSPRGPERPCWLRGPHGLRPELPDLLPERMKLPFDEPPDGAPWVVRDRRGFRTGQVARIRGGSWLVTGARLITGARFTALTRFVALTPAFPSTASRATV